MNFDEAKKLVTKGDVPFTFTIGRYGGTIVSPKEKAEVQVADRVRFCEWVEEYCEEESQQ